MLLLSRQKSNDEFINFSLYSTKRFASYVVCKANPQYVYKVCDLTLKTEIDQLVSNFVLQSTQCVSQLGSVVFFTDQ